MRLLLPLHIALKALRGNVMRTLLTMLGVVIGVSAVICTVSIARARLPGSARRSSQSAPISCGSKRVASTVE